MNGGNIPFRVATLKIRPRTGRSIIIHPLEELGIPARYPFDNQRICRSKIGRRRRFKLACPTCIILRRQKFNFYDTIRRGNLRNARLFLLEETFQNRSLIIR